MTDQLPEVSLTLAQEAGIHDLAILVEETPHVAARLIVHLHDRVKELERQIEQWKETCQCPTCEGSASTPPKPVHERESPHCSTCSCGMDHPQPEAIRALWNKAVITQDGNRATVAFETAEEAETALDYIEQLGSIAQPPGDSQWLDRAIEALERCYDVTEWPAESGSFQLTVLNELREHRKGNASRCYCGTYEWQPGTVSIKDSRGRKHFMDALCDGVPETTEGGRDDLVQFYRNGGDTASDPPRCAHAVPIDPANPCKGGLFHDYGRTTEGGQK